MYPDYITDIIRIDVICNIIVENLFYVAK